MGLSVEGDKALRRAIGPGHAPIHGVPQSASAITKDFRTELGLFGCATPNDYSSHGCKATIISWVFKRGVIPTDQIRILSGHSNPNEKSALEYYRDPVVAPLRVVSEMFAEIMSGVFDPDSARSGMMAPQSPAQEDASDEEGVVELEEDGETVNVLQSLGGVDLSRCDGDHNCVFTNQA